MTASPESQPLLPGLIPGTAKMLWRELPAVILANAIWCLFLVPLAAAALMQAPVWVLVGAVLPAALANTGLAAVADDVRLGRRVRVVRISSVDPVLALVTAMACMAAVVLISAGGGAAAAGCLVAALALLTLPLSVTYGAFRGVKGLQAVRGGVIIAIHQPGGAVSIVALAVITAFAVVATAGALMLVLPMGLALLSSRGVAVAVGRHEVLTRREAN